MAELEAENDRLRTAKNKLLIKVCRMFCRLDDLNKKNRRLQTDIRRIASIVGTAKAAEQSDVEKFFGKIHKMLEKNVVATVTGSNFPTGDCIICGTHRVVNRDGICWDCPPLKKDPNA